jgi:hypothetical protein
METFLVKTIEDIGRAYWITVPVVMNPSVLEWMEFANDTHLKNYDPQFNSRPL